MQKVLCKSREVVKFVMRSTGRAIEANVNADVNQEKSIALESYAMRIYSGHAVS